MKSGSASALEMDLLLVLGGLALVGVWIVVALLPRHTFVLAYKNIRRSDGTRSPRRTRIEVKHLVQFIGDAFMIPVCTSVLVGAVLLVVHTTVIPLPLALDILSVYRFDPVAWEHAIEHEHLGDTGALYEAWSQEQGYSAHQARFWQEFLWEHWLIVGLVGLIAIGAVYWYMTHYYARALLSYHQGVVSRRKKYIKQHRIRLGEQTTLTDVHGGHTS